MFAVSDWFAVATQRRVAEYVCKPATALAFLATAIAFDPARPDARVWFCVALGFCVVGDVLLMLPRDAFVPGLGAFLVAQLCFAVGLSSGVERAADLLVGFAVVATVAVPLCVRFVHALRVDGRPRLVGPVLAYVAAIGAMVATAIAAGPWAATAGAALFLVSDALIGETRFVRPRAWGPTAVIVTYHLALSGLVSSLVR